MTLPLHPSEFLSRLSNKLQPFAKNGLLMTSEAITCMVDLLRQLSDASRKIESLAEQRGRDIEQELALIASQSDGKVVPFVRTPKQAKTDPQHSPDGGDAA